MEHWWGSEQDTVSEYEMISSDSISHLPGRCEGLRVPSHSRAHHTYPCTGPYDPISRPSNVFQGLRRGILGVPEIISGSFRMSEMAAMGSPQLATGPQKLVPTKKDVHDQSHV